MNLPNDNVKVKLEREAAIAQAEVEMNAYLDELLATQRAVKLKAEQEKEALKQFKAEAKERKEQMQREERNARKVLERVRKTESRGKMQGRAERAKGGKRGRRWRGYGNDEDEDGGVVEKNDGGGVDETGNGNENGDGYGVPQVGGKQGGVVGKGENRYDEQAEEIVGKEEEGGRAAATKGEGGIGDQNRQAKIAGQEEDGKHPNNNWFSSSSSSLAMSKDVIPMLGRVAGRIPSATQHFLADAQGVVIGRARAAAAAVGGLQRGLPITPPGNGFRVALPVVAVP